VPGVDEREGADSGAAGIVAFVDRPAMADATGTTALRAQLQMQSTRVDLRAALRTVTVPTLLVSGAQDAICPPQFHAEIAAELPRARLVTIDGGHLLPLEQPAAFGALLRTWRAPGPE
jgi:pimeloyl-ACP methyl ester carboxylesterase